MTEKKLLTVAVSFIAFAFVLELRLVAINCKDYYQSAYRQTVKSVDVSTGRAHITDCKLNRITGRESRLKALITSRTDLREIYRNIREEDRQKFYTAVQNKRKTVVDLTAPISSDTVYITEKRYSRDNIAQNVIGYLDSEGVGIAGIEKAFEDKLKDSGEKLTLSFKVNGAGDIYGDVTTDVSRDSKVLSLTLDNSLQRIRESAAKEYIPSGSVVIMERQSGKIRAMASTPVYDANNLEKYLDMDNSPLVNKALQSYEPGSVIKPLWAATLLESGYGEKAVYYCRGYTEVDGHVYHCANDRAHGEVDMAKALEVSCNCYFIDRYIKNKALIFSQMANQMHFASPLQLCQNYYTTAGTFPTAKQLKNSGRLSSVSFGQGDFLISPVHVAAYINMIANDGIYVSPKLAEGIFDAQTGRISENLYEYEGKRVITSQTAQKVKAMLENVTENGAGGRAIPSHLGGGGKTGTAQTGRKNENGDEILNAWYCGFYPAQNPKYTICITICDGGESSVTAAPLFKRICDEIYYLEFLEKER